MAGKSPSSSPERRILSPDEIGQRLALSQDILKTQTDLFELQKDIVQDNPTQRERLLKPLLRSHHALTLLEKQNLNQSHKKDISTLRGQFMTLIREIKPDFKLNITVEEGIPTELSVEKKPNNDNTLTFGLGLSPEQQAEAQELLSRIGPKVIPPKKEASKDATPLPTSQPPEKISQQEDLKTLNQEIGKLQGETNLLLKSEIEPSREGLGKLQTKILEIGGIQAFLQNLTTEYPESVPKEVVPMINKCHGLIQSLQKKARKEAEPFWTNLVQQHREALEAQAPVIASRITLKKSGKESMPQVLERQKLISLLQGQRQALLAEVNRLPDTIPQSLAISVKTTLHQYQDSFQELSGKLPAIPTAVQENPPTSEIQDPIIREKVEEAHSHFTYAQKWLRLYASEYGIGGDRRVITYKNKKEAKILQQILENQLLTATPSDQQAIFEGLQSLQKTIRMWDSWEPLPWERTESASQRIRDWEEDTQRYIIDTRNNHEAISQLEGDIVAKAKERGTLLDQIIQKDHSPDKSTVEATIPGIKALQEVIVQLARNYKGPRAGKKLKPLADAYEIYNQSITKAEAATRTPQRLSADLREIQQEIRYPSTNRNDALERTLLFTLQTRKSQASQNPTIQRQYDQLIDTIRPRIGDSLRLSVNESQDFPKDPEALNTLTENVIMSDQTADKKYAKWLHEVISHRHRAEGFASIDLYGDALTQLDIVLRPSTTKRIQTLQSQMREITAQAREYQSQLQRGPRAILEIQGEGKYKSYTFVIETPRQGQPLAEGVYPLPRKKKEGKKDKQVFVIREGYQIVEVKNKNGRSASYDPKAQEAQYLLEADLQSGERNKFTIKSAPLAKKANAQAPQALSFGLFAIEQGIKDLTAQSPTPRQQETLQSLTQQTQRNRDILGIDGTLSL